MRFILAFILLCLWPLHAAVRYVDNAATGAGTGLSWADAYTSFNSVAWSTLNSEESTLYISGGSVSKTYTEEMQIYHPSTTSRLYIKPGSASPSPSGHDGMVIISNAGGRGIQIGRTVSAPTGTCNTVTIDGEKVGTINFAIRNCLGHGIQWRYDAQTNIHIKFVEISDCALKYTKTTTAPILSGSRSFPLSDVTGLASGFGMRIPLDPSGTDTDAVASISGNTVTSDYAVRGNVASGASIEFFSQNSGHGIGFRTLSSGLLIEDCLIQRNQDGINASYGGVVDSVQIRRTQILNNRDDGVQVGSGVTVEDCTFDGTDSIPEMHADGIQGGGGNWRVFRSRFESFTQNFFIESVNTNVNDIIIANCEFYDTGPGISLKIKESTSTNRNFQDCYIYNNTFLDCDIGVRFSQTQALGTVLSTNISNNIFSGPKGIYTEPGSVVVSPAEFLVYNNLFTTDAIGYGVNYTIADFQTATGFTGNIVAAPLFVSAPDQLEIQSGSPAVNAGLNLGATYAVDINGATRSGTWDMGANEYDAGAVPSDTTPPTLTSASIDQTGLILTLTFSENVINVSNAHYSMSGGNTLGTASTAGNTVTMSISPVIQAGAVKTLSFTSGAGRTADEAGNLLATFSGTAITNNSLEPTPAPPRPSRGGGRGGSGMRRR